ncbi:autotransporter outer membrane beta-barrel domain-containing protein [Jiella avicenniae]|uniref:Autotransporter outer membrane beta-barrel domain-containing protein n=1 Tax=Jiella avicenniae TaxID=2907202 RepID=A0A9X1NYR7_9HYPH|nr:autotransporter outer membrane beta-barrel domain-containing protein [Jiella avicenniae]MCE7026744.1 autotransporter outer membrane beta-barrel domain-containing protein [Jiella avicenniae]
MQPDTVLQKRATENLGRHARRCARGLRLPPGAALLALALLGVHRADADGLDADVRSFAVASLSRQSDLALRLTGGQTDNLKTHLEGLRGDACGPMAVRLSLGQTDATEAWQRLMLAEDEAASRSKTLQTTPKSDRCANAGRAWTGGALTLATDAPDASGRDFERVETNLSAGLDARMAADLALGVAIGGSNGDTIESEGRTRGRAALGSISAYASYHPSESSFTEAAVGLARLNVTDRVVGASGSLSGSTGHDGLGGFATVSVGRLERLGGLKVSPFLKATGQIVRLSETRQRIGEADYRIASRYATRLNGTIGVDASMPLRRLPDWISVEPKAGVEIGYALDHRTAALVAPAGSGTAEAVAETVSTGKTLLFDVGTSVKLFDEWALDVDVESRPIADGRPKTLRLSSSWNF